MLQQTQTTRVVSKYTAWLERFPTFTALAEAPLRDVLVLWKGLGYNRRALNLKHAAETVVRDFGGKFPKTYSEILSLPGVGPYTAGAIMAFAYNKPVPIIETNIRSVYIHFFFKGKRGITDKQILAKIEATLDMKNPRIWYAALMDYGVMLKEKHGNPNVKSKHYAKQTTFKGSNRELRAKILHAIAEKGTIGTNPLFKILPKEMPSKIESNLAALSREGFIVQKNHRWAIA